MHPAEACVNAPPACETSAVEDARSLERAALSYLGRFAASSVRLRQVLRRRIDRAERRGDDPDRPALEAEIDAVVQRMLDRGMLDDAAFAKGLAESLRRRGTSTRGMRAKMRQKGLSADQIDAALASDETSELEAAWRYAQRRRLGPFSRRDRAERRQKDLASMGRAGFGYGVAQAVIDGEPPE